MPDSKDEWTEEMHTNEGGRCLRCIRRRGEGCVFSDVVFFGSDETLIRVFGWVSKLRRETDPPVVEILCDLFPHHSDTIRRVEITLLNKLFKELL